MNRIPENGSLTIRLAMMLINDNKSEREAVMEIAKKYLGSPPKRKCGEYLYKQRIRINKDFTIEPLENIVIKNINI